MPGEPKASAPKFGLLRQLQQKPAQEPSAEPTPAPLNNGEAAKQKAAKAADEQVFPAPVALEQESSKAGSLPAVLPKLPSTQPRQQGEKAAKQQSSKAANLPGEADDLPAEVVKQQSSKPASESGSQKGDPPAPVAPPAVEPVKQQSSKAGEEDEGEVHFTNYLRGSVSRRLQVYVALQKAQQRRGGGERVSIKNVLNQALEEFLDRNGG